MMDWQLWGKRPWCLSVRPLLLNEHMPGNGTGFFWNNEPDWPSKSPLHLSKRGIPVSISMNVICDLKGAGIILYFGSTLRFRVQMAAMDR